MDAELKAKWVAALRSGKYQPTRRRLKDEEGGYCCLGVYCVAVLGIDPPAFGEGDDRDEMNGEIYDKLRGELGLIDGMLVTGVVAGKQDRGATFDEIADFIEADL